MADTVNSIATEEEPTQEIVGVDDTKGNERCPSDKSFRSISQSSAGSP